MLSIVNIYFHILFQSSAIWGTDSNLSSMQSLEGSEADSREINRQRDSSVDRYQNNIHNIIDILWIIRYL